MRRFGTKLNAGLSLALALTGLTYAQTSEKPDLSEEPTLYVVGYAHLDTEWRSEYPQVIDAYLRETMQDNFELFEKYPHYTFNFSGANRYRLMKEYFPADFEARSAVPVAGHGRTRPRAGRSDPHIFITASACSPIRLPGGKSDNG